MCWRGGRGAWPPPPRGDTHTLLKEPHTAPSCHPPRPTQATHLNNSVITKPVLWQTLLLQSAGVSPGRAGMRTWWPGCGWASVSVWPTPRAGEQQPC